MVSQFNKRNHSSQKSRSWLALRSTGPDSVGFLCYHGEESGGEMVSLGCLCGLIQPTMTASQTIHNDGNMELSATSAAEVLDDDHAESSRLLPQDAYDDLHGGSLTVHPDGTEYSYSYGPSGLAGLRHNQYALWCAVFASIGGLTFGYDQGVIANVLVMKDFMARWPIGPWEKGLMSACVSRGLWVMLCLCSYMRSAAVLELGALFGALSAGLLADRHSRRFSISLACGKCPPPDSVMC